jgi:hypothetical protein
MNHEERGCELRRQLSAGQAEMPDEFAESRAEARAGREALMRILDRLPPPRDPS